MARRLARGTRLVLASHNPGKLAELTDLLRPHAVTVVSAGDLGLPEPPEDAPDFVGNARIKALAAARASGLPALADNSGFCVAALNGAPGVYSARWAGAAKDFAGAMARVHREMDAATDSRAWFVAALCLAWPDEPYRDVRRPRRRHGDLAAARRQGLRLRSDVPAGRRDEDVRRTGSGGKAHGQPPRAGVRSVHGGVPGEGRELMTAGASAWHERERFEVA